MNAAITAVVPAAVADINTGSVNRRGVSRNAPEITEDGENEGDFTFFFKKLIFIALRLKQCGQSMRFIIGALALCRVT